jgi:hypothetical protein
MAKQDLKLPEGYGPMGYGEQVKVYAKVTPKKVAPKKSNRAKAAKKIRKVV